MIATAAIGLCLSTSGANAQILNDIIDGIGGGLGSLTEACKGQTLADDLPNTICAGGASLEIPLNNYVFLSAGVGSAGYLEWNTSGRLVIISINGRDLKDIARDYLDKNLGTDQVTSFRYEARFAADDKVYVNGVEYSLNPYGTTHKNDIKPYKITVTVPFNQDNNPNAYVFCKGKHLQKSFNGPCTEEKNDSHYIRIKSNVTNATITANGKADCYTGMKFDVPGQDNVTNYWSYADANVTQNWGSGIYISNYNSPGVKTISVTRVSECATITGTTTVTVPRPPDLAYYEGSTAVSPSLPSSNAIELNCTKAQYGTLLEARQDFGQIGGNAVFTWTIPSTWIATNAGTKKGEISENNISYDVYEGVWQNTLYVKQKENAANQINGGKFWAKVTTCSTQVDVIIKGRSPKTTTFDINSKQPYTVEAQDITSCVNQFSVNPIVSDSRYTPINLTWETSNIGYFSPNNTVYTGAGTGAGNLIAPINGFVPVRVRAVDKLGCVALFGPSANTSGLQNASIKVGIKSQNASGWNSGVLPTVPQTVPASGNKIVGLFSSVYYVGTNGRGYYYSFSNSAGQWLINPIAGITNGKTNGNSLAVSTRGAVLYYLNNVGSISSIATPYESGNTPSTIVPGTAGAISSLEVDNRVGSPSRGTLYFRGANNYIYKYNPATDAQASVFVAENTVYDIRAYNARVFYITQINGTPQLKFRDAGTTTSTVIFTGPIWEETEIDLNTEGDVFFVSNGHIIYLAKTPTGYAAPFMLQDSNGEYLNGSFTVNQNTGTIYASANPRIYTYFKENNVWRVKYASSTYSDNAGVSLFYATPNLLYVNNSGIIYNLYYFAGCPPDQFRMGDVEVTKREESSISAQLYPNPFQDVLEVNVQGEGEATLELTDLSGRVVSSTPYYFTPTQLATSSLHKGIYLCRVVQDGKQVFVTKVQK